MPALTSGCGVEGPRHAQMSESSRAVFLSYAREDTDAARRIADALQAAGIEVWLDQSDLEGGDVWDQKIRRQIKDCALFVPVISANTQERYEGYFRLRRSGVGQRAGRCRVQGVAGRPEKFGAAMRYPWTTSGATLNAQRSIFK